MKILIILPLVAMLNACLISDKTTKPKAVIVEDKGHGEVVAIVGEKSSFVWKESNNPFSELEVMLEDDRKEAVKGLKASGANFSLYFNYDNAEINKEAAQEISKHAQFMQDNPIVRLRLEGYTDARGTREYNLALGENRALSVKKAMGFYKGVDERIEVISYGEENPQSKMNDEIGWQKNRRVEFIYK